jgi:uncharacterized damage-inducible protein DinB
MTDAKPEVWLRGPIEGVPPALQPVAHALLQATEEIKVIMDSLPSHLLWDRPAGVASPGFHLLHMCGVIDRMRTYASGKQLSEEQFADLKAEKEEGQIAPQELVRQVRVAVESMIEFLKEIDPNILTQARAVGRKQLPSTVIGLLFHAAEHVQRHNGQLLVTVKVLTAGHLNGQAH